MQTLRQDAQAIIDKALADALPDSAVRRALEQFQKPEGRLVLIAAGKAAWQMAKAAYDVLGTAITSGAVITKYDHVKGPIGALELFEAGHPVPDENSYRATSRALELVSGLSERDTVLFLLSGGGSALFESPLVPAEEMADVTKQLLACGADIVEMNTLRKRLSAVKGGRFAERCLPAKVFSIVLSDILGDPLDMIASGPAYPDSSTCAQALEVVRKYGLRLSESALELLAQETPKTLTNVETHITGSVRQLCASAEQTARALGYTPVILTASLRCTARDAGSFLASIAQCHQDSKTSLAYIAGGETVVHLTGHGLPLVGHDRGPLRHGIAQSALVQLRHGQLPQIGHRAVPDLHSGQQVIRPLGQPQLRQLGQTGHAAEQGGLLHHRDLIAARGQAVRGEQNAPHRVGAQPRAVRVKEEHARAPGPHQIGLHITVLQHGDRRAADGGIGVGHLHRLLFGHAPGGVPHRDL